MNREELLLPRFLCFVLVSLMWGEIPPMFFFGALALLGFSMMRIWNGRRELARWLLGVLAPVAAALVFWSMGTLIGKEPSGALLAVLSGLKALESREDKDEKSLALIGLFLVCVVFLFQGDLWMGFFGAGATLGFLFLLFRKVEGALSRTGAWKWTWRLTLRALPLTVLLFLVVPRLQHQWIWKMTSTGITGFREELSPVLVDNIVEDDTPVLRAVWNGGELGSPIYWRGAVLEEAKGFSWVPGHRARESHEALDISPEGTLQVSYTLEPHSGSWSFAPEGSIAARDADTGESLRASSGQDVWRFSSAVTKRRNVIAQVRPDHRPSGMENESLLAISNPPEEATEFLRKALGGAKNLSRSEIARRLLERFPEESFVYTRSPGRIPDLKSFLKTKKGFCEHYASALALLLRQAGVPARVAVGYLGGRKNPVGGFTLVTEADAHAWVEYLSDDGRWISADATAFVPPLDPLSDRRFADIETTWEKSPWWERLRWSLDSFNYQFILFFMNFDLETQKDLWQRLRVAGPFPVVLLGLGLLALIAFSWREWRWGAAAETREMKNYRRLLSRARERDPGWPPDLGPKEALERFERLWPDRREELRRTVQNYISSRFGKNDPRPSDRHP